MTAMPRRAWSITQDWRQWETSQCAPLQNGLHPALTECLHTRASLSFYWWPRGGVVMAYIDQSSSGVWHIVRCRYNTVFTKFLTIDTTQLALAGELWGVFCEFRVWFVLCLKLLQCFMQHHMFDRVISALHCNIDELCKRHPTPVCHQWS